MIIPLCPRCNAYPDTVMHAPRCKADEWTGEDFAIRAVAESMRAIEAQRAIIDAVRALAVELDAERPSSSAWRGAYRNNARRLRAILDATPEAPTRGMAPVDTVIFDEAQVLDDGEVGRCLACNRMTWDADNIGHQCLMTQPDGSQCPGVFVPEAGGSSE